MVAFAKEHGVPVAIKAAYGGGGRGLKVARTLEEIPELYESAVREAVGAFGRGECFVEKYLDKPRHVETQCLADSHGNVVVVSTRDCSLQRRHQKLVEEAPAPFLTDAQNAELYRASKAILAEAGYVGAGTCEFLVGQDGTISFLEVNTRLQVEHPVTEEVTGIDLVREMFRIADGEPLGYDDPPVARPLDRVPDQRRGRRPQLPARARARHHLPAPDRSRRPARLRCRGGRRGRRRLRLDAGQADRDRCRPGSRRWSGPGGRWPSSRSTGCRRCCRSTGPSSPTRRSRRTGDKPFTIHTRWIETEFDNTIEPWAGATAESAEPGERERIVVEVGGKRLEVVLPAGLGAAAGRSAGARSPRRTGGKKTGAAASGDSLTSPMQGTIVKVVAEDGQQVAAGDPVVVLEAMKMEQPLNAHKAGTITGLTAAVGETVTSGAVICEIKD